MWLLRGCVVSMLWLIVLLPGQQIVYNGRRLYADRPRLILSVLFSDADFFPVVAGSEGLGSAAGLRAMLQK